MYERILLPTDGSRENDQVVRQAVGLATETGAELHVLFVVEDIPYAPEMAEEDIEAQLREIGEGAIEAIRAEAEEAGVELQTAIEKGVPHRAIVEYADSTGIDLIVMGTHARSGLGRYLLGSVTERVVRTADVPVLTVRMKGDE